MHESTVMSRRRFEGSLRTLGELHDGSLREVERLLDETESLRAERDSLVAELAASRDAAKAAQHRAESLEAALDQRDQQIRGLEDSRSQLQAKYIALKQKAVELEAFKTTVTSTILSASTSSSHHSAAAAAPPPSPAPTPVHSHHPARRPSPTVSTTIRETSHFEETDQFTRASASVPVSRTIIEDHSFLSTSTANANNANNANSNAFSPSKRMTPSKPPLAGSGGGGGGSSAGGGSFTQTTTTSSSFTASSAASAARSIGVHRTPSASSSASANPKPASPSRSNPRGATAAGSARLDANVFYRQVKEVLEKDGFALFAREIQLLNAGQSTEVTLANVKRIFGDNRPFLFSQMERLVEQAQEDLAANTSVNASSFHSGGIDERYTSPSKPHF